MHDSEIDYSHPIIEFIAGANCALMPADVVDTAKRCVLDTLAALLIGSRSEAGGIAAEYTADTWSPGMATVFATARKVATAGAGFANGVAANGTDIDDVGRFTWGHPGAVVVPAALALAEEQQVSGARLIEAVVIGYEIAFRSGRILNYGLDPELLGARREYRACGSWGAPSVAAMAGHIRRYSNEHIAHSLGIAEYHAPEALMLRDTEAPAMVKHAIGPGIMTGIMAADLAGSGFTGVPSYLLSPRFADWTLDAGEFFHLPRGVSFKRYSCCSFAHAALEATESLLDGQDNLADRVVKIRVETYSDAVLLGTRVPETSSEAQFSVAWSIAVLLQDGDVHPRAMQSDRLACQSTRALAGRVEMVENPELTRLFLLSEDDDPNGREAAIVHLTLDDGTVLSSGMIDNVLFPQPPVATSTIEAKFRWVTEDLLDAKQARELIELCADLENLPAAGDLVAAAVAR